MENAKDKVAKASRMALAAFDEKTSTPTIDDCALLAADIVISENGGGIDRAEYEQLVVAVDSVRRDNGDFYVCQSFRPERRNSPQYRLLRRMREIFSRRAMTENERKIAVAMLEIRMAGTILAGKPYGVPYPFQREETCSLSR